VPKPELSETPAQEYERLARTCEEHRIVQARQAEALERYQRKRLQVVREMEGVPDDPATNNFMAALFNATPPPVVPGEIVESRRLHELHTLIAKGADHGPPR
jgi:hypothetical protein